MSRGGLPGGTDAGAGRTLGLRQTLGWGRTQAGADSGAGLDSVTGADSGDYTCHVSSADPIFLTHSLTVRGESVCHWVNNLLKVSKREGGD